MYKDPTDGPAADLTAFSQQIEQRRETLKTAVADVLREAISSGVLRDGEELNQVALAEQLGVSRIPMREAICQLESEGLLETRPHRRTVVASLTPDLLLELCEIRVSLECLALRHAVPNLSPADLAALEVLHVRMESETDLRDWLRLNRDFHLKLSFHSHMQVLCELIRRLRRNTERYLARIPPVRRFPQAGIEHRQLLDACERSDGTAAQRILEDHIRGVFAELLDHFPEVRESTGARRPTSGSAPTTRRWKPRPPEE